MTPAEFVAFFCSTHRAVTPTTNITRITWEYPRICRVCGCTDYSACDTLTGPCAWIQTFADNTGICTACPPPTTP